MSLESLEAQGLNFVNFNGVTVSTIENDLTLSWTRDLAHTFTTSSGISEFLESPFNHHICVIS